MFHTGSDAGQAGLGAWARPAERHASTPLQAARAELQAAGVAYVWTLQQAHKEVDAAAAEVRASDARTARAAANLADAEAAQTALRLRSGGQDSEAGKADLLRSQAEVEVRRERLAVLQSRRQAARAALAVALGCGGATEGG